MSNASNRIRIDISSEIPGPVSVVKPQRKLLMQALETPASTTAQVRTESETNESWDSQTIEANVRFERSTEIVKQNVSAVGAKKAHVRMDGPHLGLQQRRVNDVTTISLRLFALTTETIHGLLKDLTSAKHWVSRLMEMQPVQRERGASLVSELERTIQILFSDGQHLAWTQARVAKDKSVVTYESHLITADLLARITTNLATIDQISNRFKLTVLSSSHIVSATILNRIESGKADLMFNRGQFEDLSRVIAILREEARSQVLRKQSHLPSSVRKPMIASSARAALEKN